MTVLCIIMNPSYGETDEHDHDHEESDHIFNTTEHDSHEHEHDHESDNAGLALLITCFAGTAAFIGCFTVFCINPKAMMVIPISLSFAAGVIIHLSFMSLVPESIGQFDLATGEENEALAHFYALLCVILGLMLMGFFEYI